MNNVLYLDYNVLYLDYNVLHLDIKCIAFRCTMYCI